MKLVVDIGNSRVKWAWLADGQLREPAAVAHGGRVPPGWPAATGIGRRRPESVLVASVAAAPLTRALLDALVGPDVPVRQAAVEREAAGVSNGYADPRQLGIDRWLAVLAAFDRHRSAVCVVDAGTAVTVDAVDGGGHHLGGLIVPGAALMRRALLERTGGIGAAAALGGASPAGAGGPWGRDTDSCIDQGGWMALACLVRGCVEALAGVAGPGGARLVITGGDAGRLLPLLNRPAEHRPELVLEGLALRYGTGDGR